MVEQKNNALERTEEIDEATTMTWENIGKGLAFLGTVLFLGYVIFFVLSFSMPQLYNLFSGATHLIGVSVVSLTLIIGGYFMTKIKTTEEEDIPEG